MLCQFLITILTENLHHSLCLSISLSSSFVQNWHSAMTIGMVMYTHFNYNVKYNSLYSFHITIFVFFFFLGYDVGTLVSKIAGNHYFFYNMWSPPKRVEKWVQQVLPRLQWQSIMWILHKILSQRSPSNPSRCCLIL